MSPKIHHTIATIPTELVEVVAGFLEVADLKRFRLANKACQEKSFKVFSTATFSSRTVLLSSKQSLEANLEAVKTVALGSLVRFVTILLDEFSPGAPYREALQAVVLRAKQQYLQG